MTSIICNKQKLLSSQRVCCFDNDSIEIEYQFDINDVLTIVFNFHYDEENTRYTLNSKENGKVVLDLYNFKSSLGTGLKTPQIIGKYKGKTISIVFFVTLLPEANPIVDYSLYLEV